MLAVGFEQSTCSSEKHKFSDQSHYLTLKIFLMCTRQMNVL